MGMGGVDKEVKGHLDALRKTLTEQGLVVKGLHGSFAVRKAEQEAAINASEALMKELKTDLGTISRSFNEFKKPILGDIQGAGAQLKILSARIEALSTEVEQLKKTSAGMADISAVKSLISNQGKEVYASIRDAVGRLDALESAARKK